MSKSWKLVLAGERAPLVTEGVVSRLSWRTCSSGAFSGEDLVLDRAGGRNHAWRVVG